jgi:glutaminase
VVVETIMNSLESLDYLILDFKHILSLNESAGHLFYELLMKLTAMGKPVVFTHPGKVPGLRRYLRFKLKDQIDEYYQTFGEMDLALEWCEDKLLANRLPVWSPDNTTEVDNYELFDGLNAQERAVIKSMLSRKTYQSGEVIVQFGEEAKELFFLKGGSASVTVTLASGEQKRIATFSPGMVFGEMAMLDRAPRSAVVTADMEVTCELLKLDDFEALSGTHPNIKITLLKNLALGLCRKLRKANREISVFDY